MIIMLLTAAALLTGGPARAAFGDHLALQPSAILMSMASTAVFGLIGIGLAAAGFRIFDWLTPFNLENEVCQKQNVAVGIVCGAMILGICLIVAAAVL